MNRKTVIKTLTTLILEKPCAHPLRVAIDGVDAAGKTCLADELSQALQTQPRPVIRASVDGFHHPKVVRRQAGDLSPEGFYRDSYNYPALIENLLAPLGPKGSRRYRTAVFDVAANRPLDLPLQTAPADAILLMDGIFLLRPLLLPYWDLTLFLKVDFTVTVPRGIARDGGVSGTTAEVQTRYTARYVPGQQLYLREVHPLDKANIVVDNNDLERPKIIRPLPPERPKTNPGSAKE